MKLSEWEIEPLIDRLLDNPNVISNELKIYTLGNPLAYLNTQKKTIYNYSKSYFFLA